MITGLYSAASGMVAHVEHQDIIAHNLANVGTTGFRKQRMVFRSFPDVLLNKMSGGPPPPGSEVNRHYLQASKVGTGSGMNWSYVDFSHGMIQRTGRDTDVALSSDGFFVVETPNGERYTRNGEFYVSADDGILRTSEGDHAVLDVSGAPLQTGNEPFTIARDGSVMQNGARIGQLWVVDFGDRNLLMPEGSSLFKFDGQDIDEQRGPAEHLHVTQGSLERANANPLLEMVYLTDSYRNYESSQRVIAAIDRSVERLISDVGTL